MNARCVSMVPKVIHAWFVVMLFDPVADQQPLVSLIRIQPVGDALVVALCCKSRKITLAAWAQCTWIKVVQIPSRINGVTWGDAGIRRSLKLILILPLVVFARRLLLLPTVH